jgi:hypothetical protein
MLRPSTVLKMKARILFFDSEGEGLQASEMCLKRANMELHNMKIRGKA